MFDPSSNANTNPVPNINEENNFSKPIINSSNINYKLFQSLFSEKKKILNTETFHTIKDIYDTYFKEYSEGVTQSEKKSKLKLNLISKNTITELSKEYNMESKYDDRISEFDSISSIIFLYQQLITKR